MKTVLITGINGFLGSHLAKKLVQNYKVIGIENSLNDLFRLQNNSFDVKLSDAMSIESIFKNHVVDFVIHTATIYSDDDPIRLIDSNVLLPLRLLIFCKKFATKYFINTDSFFNNTKFNYNYLGDYTLSKKHAFEWLLHTRKNVHIINMKLEHMYGPLDSANKFVPNILYQMKRNVEKIDLTLGLQKRDFVFIEDVVTAYEVLLQKIDGISTHVVDIAVGLGIPISIREFVETAKKVTQCKTILNFGAIPYREGEIMESCADNSFLLNLGWRPLFSIEKGLQKMIATQPL